MTRYQITACLRAETDETKRADLFWMEYESNHYGSHGGYSPEDFAEMTGYLGDASLEECLKRRAEKEKTRKEFRKQRTAEVAKSRIFRKFKKRQDVK
jgi:hypothetical protein